MDYSWLIPLLSLGTMLAVLVFAIASKAAIEARRHDPNAPKSTLAKDGPQGGVAFLMPLTEQIALHNWRMYGQAMDRTVTGASTVRPVLE